MDKLVNLLFQANMLKAVPRSGYQYLGVGRESVADHVFTTTFIGWVLAQVVQDVDEHKLVCMCLMHDLLEARLGDLNYLQKTYLNADEAKALEDTVEGLPFADKIRGLIEEFEKGETPEARLARDADQLSLILDLKTLQDIGHKGPEIWLEVINERLKTSAGKRLAETIMTTHKDQWWLYNNIDSYRQNN